jgi:hypothetical protein
MASTSSGGYVSAGSLLLQDLTLLTTGCTYVNMPFPFVAVDKYSPQSTSAYHGSVMMAVRAQLRADMTADHAHVLICGPVSAKVLLRSAWLHAT